MLRYICDGMNNAGVKHSLSVYTRNNYDFFFVVKTGLRPFLASNHQSFHLAYQGSGFVALGIHLDSINCKQITNENFKPI